MKRFLLALLVVGIVGFAASTAKAQCYRGGGYGYSYPSVYRYNYRPHGYYRTYPTHGHHHHHYHRGYNTHYYRGGGGIHYRGGNFGIYYRF